MLPATGAIPFIVLSPPVAALLPLPPDLVASAALLQLGYGASIASFLGGIHWAMAMARYGGARPAGHSGMHACKAAHADVDLPPA